MSISYKHRQKHQLFREKGAGCDITRQYQHPSGKNSRVLLTNMVFYKQVVFHWD